MADKYKISPISAETWAAIKNKSAFNLPDRPTERGMKPAEIKRALHGPITDPNASVLAELARVIGDANDMLNLIYQDTSRSEITVTQIEGGKRITIIINDVETSVDIMDGKDSDSIIPAITNEDEGKALVVEGGKLIYKAIEASDSSALDELHTLIGEGV